MSDRRFVIMSSRTGRDDRHDAGQFLCVFVSGDGVRRMHSSAMMSNRSLHNVFYEIGGTGKRDDNFDDLDWSGVLHCTEAALTQMVVLLLLPALFRGKVSSTNSSIPVLPSFSLSYVYVCVRRDRFAKLRRITENVCRQIR